MTSILPNQYSLKVGDILQTPISASRDVEDTVATETLRQAARDSVSQIYRFDEHITESVIVEVGQIIEQIYNARQLAQDKFEDYKQELENQWENQESIDEQEETGETNAEITDTEEIVEPSPDEILTEQFIGEIKQDFPIMLSNDEILTCLNADKTELDQLRDQLLDTLNKLLDLHIKQDNLLEAKNTLRDEIMSLPVSNETGY